MNTIFQSKQIPDSIVFKTYFGGNFVYKTDGVSNYANQKIMCSYSRFDAMTASIAVLSGTTMAVFSSVEFMNCPMVGQTNVITSTCSGVVLFMCTASYCNASDTARFVSHSCSAEAELSIELTSFSQCGILENDWRCIYVNGGVFMTSELNMSHCYGSKQTTISTDETDKGSFHRHLKICSNSGKYIIMTFEKAFNIIRASIAVNNGDADTLYLIYSSESNTEYRGCYFEGNTGATNFYYVFSNNIKLAFIGCYLQPLFGGKTNNALTYSTDAVLKEGFNELLNFIPQLPLMSIACRIQKSLPMLALYLAVLTLQRKSI